MKRNLLYLFLFISISALIVSCDPTDGPDEPDVDPRDKFVGSWICNETSTQNGNSTYNVIVSLNPTNSAQILLAQFYQMSSGQKVYAIVANNNATVPEQTLTGLVIKGSGNYSTTTSKINWTYYVNDGADIDTCTAVYSK